MAMSEREIWYTTAVTEEPQVASFSLPYSWFVLAIFLDEEDHGPLALPYLGRIHVDVTRRVGTGLLGRRESVGSVDITSGQAGHILVKPEQYSFHGEYQATVTYHGPPLTGDYGLFIQAFGEGVKGLSRPQAPTFESWKSVACYVRFDDPLPGPADVKVMEYLPDSAYPMFTGTPSKVEVASGTIPTGETIGRVVVEKAFGWHYDATVSAPSGSGSHVVMWAGLTR